MTGQNSDQLLVERVQRGDKQAGQKGHGGAHIVTLMLVESGRFFRMSHPSLDQEARLARDVTQAN